MTETHGHTQIPRPILLGAGAVLAVALALSTLSSQTGVGSLVTPEAEAVETRVLQFADRADGSVLVSDADSGQKVFVAEPGTNGFLRGVMRGMSRIRKLEQIERGTPYHLTLWHNGRLSLIDPATGWDVKLELFGPDNYRVFAGLLAGDHTEIEGGHRTAGRREQ